MKKIILTFIVIFLVLIIYIFNRDKKIYILYIGDNIALNRPNVDRIISEYKKDKLLEKFVEYKNNNDYRSIDLLNDVDNNIKFQYKNKNYTLDNALIKADVIIISIGNNDLKYCEESCSYQYIDEVIGDLNKLFNHIRKYSKEKIYIYPLKVINNIELNKYMNKKFNHLIKKYQIEKILLY